MDYLLTWGGIPELLNLIQESRRQWLKAYRQTYLERDLGDLARLNDLAPLNVNVPRLTHVFLWNLRVDLLF